MAVIDRLSAVIGDNQDYYFREFDKIERGQRPAFNWAAFFLTGCHLLYRRMGGSALFLGGVLPVLALFALSLLAAVISPAAGLALGVAAGLSSLACAVVCGACFNRSYYRAVLRAAERPRPAAPSFIAPMLLLTGSAAYAGLIGVFLVASLLVRTVPVQGEMTVDTSSGEEAVVPSPPPAPPLEEESYIPGEAPFWNDTMLRVSSLDLEGGMVIVGLDAVNYGETAFPIGPEYFRTCLDGEYTSPVPNPARDALASTLLAPGEQAGGTLRFPYHGSGPETLCFFSNPLSGQPDLSFFLPLEIGMMMYIGEEPGAIELADFLGTPTDGPNNLSFLGDETIPMEQYGEEDFTVTGYNDGVLAFVNKATNMVDGLYIAFDNVGEGFPRGYYYYTIAGLDGECAWDDVTELYGKPDNIEDEGLTWEYSLTMSDYGDLLGRFMFDGDGSLKAALICNEDRSY